MLNSLRFMSLRQVKKRSSKGDFTMGYLDQDHARFKKEDSDIVPLVQKVFCESDLCQFNKSGRCIAPKVELGTSGWDFHCKTCDP